MTVHCFYMRLLLPSGASGRLVYRRGFAMLATLIAAVFKIIVFLIKLLFWTLIIVGAICLLPLLLLF